MHDELLLDAAGGVKYILEVHTCKDQGGLLNVCEGNSEGCKEPAHQLLLLVHLLRSCSKLSTGCQFNHKRGDGDVLNVHLVVFLGH